MVKELICNISEEDFRKLDLKGYKSVVFRDTPRESGKHRFLQQVSLNDMLDEELKELLDSGYEHDEAYLEQPVTVALYEDPTDKDYANARKMYPHLPDYGCDEIVRIRFMYLDKFMNRFTGARSYQIGFGIKHLYSTRDYYEAREDYWKVRKAETKVIYRIKLSDKWKNEFVLKHKTEKEDWKFNVLPDGVRPDFDSGKFCKHYDKVDGEWKVTGYTGEFRFGQCLHIIPVDENGNKINTSEGNA